MELIIYSPTENEFVKEILFNHDELKIQITEALAKYRGQVYGETEIKEAKVDRAKLNNFVNAMETKRKEIKNKCLDPYTKFESKYSEILNLVKDQVNEIDMQVKKFETKQKEKKRADLERVFNENNPLPEILKFEQIFDNKWLNATTKREVALRELAGKLEKVESDLTTLTGLESKYQHQMKDVFYRSLDLNLALAEQTRLTNLERIENENAIKKELETATVPEIQKKQMPVQLEKPVEQDQHKELLVEEVEVLEFRVWVTPEQKEGLKQFLAINNIKYGRI